MTFLDNYIFRLFLSTDNLMKLMVEAKNKEEGLPIRSKVFTLQE